MDAAIREAIYALDTLGADGVKLATNSRGQYLGDEELDPLMEVLNERHAVIIIHPHRPTPCAEDIIQTTPLAPTNVETLTDSKRMDVDFLFCLLRKHAVLAGN